MPELKNLFIKGKMNKDLDERLVPQGEYRDALNVSVSYSEGSDVGALQNILGNTERVKNRTDINVPIDPDTPSTFATLSFPSGATCIGTARDTETDKIYWFGTSATADYIAELDPFDNSVDIILCDTGSILNFSTSNLITGVAVLDEVLYFTDDLNEPRQVDIEQWRSVTGDDFTTTSTNLSDDKITLIRKSPINAPNLVLKNTKSNGKKTRTSGSPFNYVDTNPFIAGDQTVEVGSVTTYSFSSDDSFINYDWNVGDELKIHNINHDAFLIEKITSTSSNGYTATKIAIVGDLPDEPILWSHSLIEEPVLYEFNFVRFAYRWKYEINNITQYSLISPFSEAAFIPGDFKYNTLKGFNLAMENTLQKITLNTFDPKPADVVEVEILFKYSNSPNIYKIAELTTETEFSFEKEIKGEIIPSNQLLRAFDSIPKKAKALELSGNRLIFGNYVQNFDVTKPAFEIELIDRSGASEAKQSIKSKRIYEFGVVYLDEYQRQTPVLTDKTGVFDVPYGGGNSLTSLFSSSQFKAKITTSYPSWATHYRYFIKENSNEYYNLALATVVKTDNGFYYLGFPSSEVNKIKEGDFIIMKKSFNNKIVEDFEKNKIASIHTEAPDEVKLRKSLHFKQNDTAFLNILNTDPLDKKLSNASPSENSNEFVIGGARAVPGTIGPGNLSDYEANGLTQDGFDKIQESDFVRFSIGNARTKYYKINKFLDIPSSAIKDLKITLEEDFSTDIDFLYEYSSTADDYILKPNITTEFFKEEDVSYKYDGLFFAKVQENAVLKNNLQLDTALRIVDAERLYTDRYDRTQFYIVGGGKSGVVDSSINTDQGGALTYDGIDWQLSLQKFVVTNTDQRTFQDALKIGAKVRFKDYIGISANPDSATKKANLEGVATLTIINGGTGYSDGTNITVSGGQGTNLTLNITTTNNVITSVTVGDNPGVKYTNGDIITVSGGDGNAKIELTVVEEEIYTITDMRTVLIDSSYDFYVYHLNFDKNFIKDLPFENFTSAGIEYERIEIEVLEEKENFDLTEEKSPPIFETFPEESVLELYYETQETWPVSSHGNFNDLKWFNCFTFNNGVESNRIRDDYNAIQIDKGPKVSTTFEEEYKEERVKNGLIFSGLYNKKNGVNRLNQFIIAENITEEINPVYGNIQKLNTRDTDLTLLCDDKILKAPIRKDLLFQADGNPQVLSSDRFIGTIIPYQGNYGCQHPESFADHIYRAYFVDRTRGKVLRLSGDGITEISNYGMKDYFKDKLVAETGYMFGSYDENKDQYNISLPVENTVVSFSESVNGWPTRKSFYEMESGISLNNMYYTFKDGKIFSHDNETRNTFYDTKTDSKVTFYLNGNPGNAKNFRTLNYQGDSGWISSNIATDKQTGNVSSFVEKEGIYYNYISGETQATKESLDLKALNVQGLGTPTSISSNDATFTNLNNAIQVGDVVYDSTMIGTDTGKSVTAISGNTITLDSAPANAFSYFVKDNRFNTSGILGYYAEITMTNTATNKKELYSVGSEVSLSS